MGERGPVPKRSENRIRRNKPENEGGIPLSKGVARGFSSWPQPADSWDDSVVRTYNSFRNSGMVDYYEETDVQLIWQACDQLQTHRDNPKRSAQAFDYVFKALKELGATEAERRRMRIELVNENDTKVDMPELAVVTKLKTNSDITGVA